MYTKIEMIYRHHGLIRAGHGELASFLEQAAAGAVLTEPIKYSACVCLHLTCCSYTHDNPSFYLEMPPRSVPLIHIPYVSLCLRRGGSFQVYRYFDCASRTEQQ